jgi:glutathione synthase/RimK-type ligase-like ATP-grasp enzyme
VESCEDSQIHTLCAQFMELASGVQVYPSILENYRDGHKLNVVRDLDKIAREVTNTARPQSARHMSAIPGNPVVAKRNSSSYGEHVFQLHPGDRPPKTHSVHHFYFFQEYVPALMKVGEIRVYIANCQDVVYRVATTADERDKGKVTSWLVDRLFPLSTWNARE